MADQVLDPDRVARVAGLLADAERDPEHRLCAASAAILLVSGAAVVLMEGGRASGSVCVSNALTEAVEDAQYTLGEGPAVDAFRTKAPVLAPDLTDAEPAAWPGFREAATAAGARAAFGFPLMVGPVCIGALDLYQDRSGALSDDQMANAAVVAHLVGRAVMGWQSSATPGAIAWQLEQVPAHRAVVHQATGMISVQASASIGDALMLLRAYAFAEARPISGVAEAIVDGSLRLG